MIPFLTPLDASQLRANHIPEPWAYGIADRVRFGELDILGHVNNAAYLRWFENLRVQYFRDYGMFDFTGTPPKLVVRGLSLAFLKEVKLHDEYIMTGRTVAMRTSSFTMHYGIWVKGQLTTTGDAVLVTLNDDNSKKPLSSAIKHTLSTRDGATQA